MPAARQKVSERPVEQFLAAIRKIIIQAIDWLFWAIALVWSWSFGQFSRALSQPFRSLPDWKAILYILLVALLLYIAYLAIPRILAAILAIFRAVMALLETLVRIVLDLIWYIVVAYGIALAITTVKVGTLFTKMPWQ